METNTDTPTYYILRLRMLNAVDKDSPPIIVGRNEARTNYLPSSHDAYFITSEEAVKFADDRIPSILMLMGDLWIKTEISVEVLGITFIARGEAHRLVKWA